MIMKPAKIITKPRIVAHASTTSPRLVNSIPLPREVCRIGRVFLCQSICISMPSSCVVVQHCSHGFGIIPTTNDVTNAQSEWMDFHTSFFSIGASNRTRTGTPPLKQAADFKSAVSTNFTIEAELVVVIRTPPNYLLTSARSS